MPAFTGQTEAEKAFIRSVPLTPLSFRCSEADANLSRIAPPTPPP